MNSILVKGYTESEGACRGGNNPQNQAGRRYYMDRKCKDRCSTSRACTGYDMPSLESWCDTYTSEGATGNGLSNMKCYMKQRGIYSRGS